MEKKSWREKFSKFQNLTDEEIQKNRVKNDEVRVHRENEQRNKQLEKLWKNDWPAFSGRFEAATFDNFVLHGSEADQNEQTRIVTCLREIELRELFQNGRNILFIGPPGSGKDHLMFSMLRKAFEGLRGQTGIKFLNGSEFRLTTRTVRRSDQESEQAFVDKLTKKKLLCISDPAPTGGASLSESQADCLYHVLDKRGFDRRPTWMTVNLPLGQRLREEGNRVFTAPLWDRMKHDAIIVATNWPSFRTPMITL